MLRASSNLTLVLDTASDTPSLALAAEQTIIATTTLLQKRVAADLAVCVYDLLAQAHASMQDITTVMACVGTGSFTGIRLGLAFAHGLCLSRPRRALGVSRLAMLAALHPSDNVVAVLPSIQGDVFVQKFQAGAAVSDIVAIPHTSLEAWAEGLPIADDARALDAAMMLRFAPRLTPLPLQPLYGRAHYAA
jgi:tRNA threonylcarbamoyladenosine biosynthesis protein TsaB